ncbi:Kelch motif family protein [Reticulomyxa filosa]|uniref:Kelch motif family protein n=1 Tax=Reticulomyxa filosa TaxID=46433 RepID=X6MIL5_RETFI|nr:Kelch motif family protein [Reticulomyxa filosa]|eukprot:ETO12870.1 Kelch motif family protein [Reticulomyxa filosa]
MLLDTSGDVPSPRKSSTLAYHDGNLYLFGGNHKEKCLNDLYKYEIKSRSWSQIVVKGKSPCARDRHSLTVVNEDSLLLFGGFGNEQEFLSDLWCFDIKAKTWTLLPEQGTVPSPRYEHAAVGIGPFLVVAGGKSSKGGMSDLYVFDWAKQIWNVPKFEEDVKIDPAWGQSAVVFHNKSDFSFSLKFVFYLFVCCMLLAKYTLAFRRIILFGGWNGKVCFNDVTVIDCKQSLVVDVHFRFFFFLTLDFLF